MSSKPHCLIKHEHIIFTVIFIKYDIHNKPWQSSPPHISPTSRLDISSHVTYYTFGGGCVLTATRQVQSPRGATPWQGDVTRPTRNMGGSWSEYTAQLYTIISKAHIFCAYILLPARFWNWPKSHHWLLINSGFHIVYFTFFKKKGSPLSTYFPPEIKIVPLLILTSFCEWATVVELARAWNQQNHWLKSNLSLSRA